MKDRNLIAILGNALGVVGTSLQTEDLLRIISLIITIIGGIITWIVIPILNWYNKSKEDGKIDNKELSELKDIVNDASKHFHEQDENKKEGEKHEQD